MIHFDADAAWLILRQGIKHTHTHTHTHTHISVLQKTKARILALIL